MYIQSKAQSKHFQAEHAAHRADVAHDVAHLGHHHHHHGHHHVGHHHHHHHGHPHVHHVPPPTEVVIVHQAPPVVAVPPPANYPMGSQPPPPTSIYHILGKFGVAKFSQNKKKNFFHTQRQCGRFLCVVGVLSRYFISQLSKICEI